MPIYKGLNINQVVFLLFVFLFVCICSSICPSVSMDPSFCRCTYVLLSIHCSVFWTLYLPLSPFVFVSFCVTFLHLSFYVSVFVFFSVFRGFLSICETCLSLYLCLCSHVFLSVTVHSSALSVLCCFLLLSL